MTEINDEFLEELGASIPIEHLSVDLCADVTDKGAQQQCSPPFSLLPRKPLMREAELLLMFHLPIRGP